MKIFVAGATGAVGLPLVRVLRALGHDVTGLTRAGAGVDRLRELGALASCADAFDRAAIAGAVREAAPDVMIDQLTWLPADPANLITSMPDDNRLHRDGGANLLSAAREAGVARYMLQSRGFYLDAPAGSLADETASLRTDAPGVVGEGTRILADYEDAVRADPHMAGTVLRYGFFYGPGTWYRPGGAIADQLRAGTAPIIGDGDAVWSFVHIDDAIAATVAAIDAPPGTYNLVDDDPLPVADWLPAFARWVDAPQPTRIAADAALSGAGEEAVWYHRALTGASNLRARADLGFRPRPLLWRDA